jgi:hypothetical protein
MDAVEQRCPRFFPPGGGQPALLQGAQLRKYAASDVRLWVMPEGVVMYQYYRAMNPTQVGSVEDVIAGRSEDERAAVLYAIDRAEWLARQSIATVPS